MTIDVAELRRLIGQEFEGEFRLGASEAIALLDEHEKLREFIAASKECADANVALELEQENERLRTGISEVLTKIQAGSTVHVGFCVWCNEKWVHPDGATPEQLQELSRRHTFRCTKNPLKLERDALSEANADLKAALRRMLEDFPNDDDIHEMRKLIE